MDPVKWVKHPVAAGAGTQQLGLTIDFHTLITRHSLEWKVVGFWQKGWK